MARQECLAPGVCLAAVDPTPDFAVGEDGNARDVLKVDGEAEGVGEVDVEPVLVGAASEPVGDSVKR